MSRVSRLALPAALALLAACGDKGGDDSGSPAGGATDAELAASLWTEIADHASWEQVSGWEGIQPSTDGTHGDYVQIWVNPDAAATLAAAAGGEMPDGAVIVKEGYADGAGASVNAVTAMKKIAGYAPDAGDWFWAAYDTEGNVMTAGQSSSCVDCHALGQDYVRFTTW